jgi:hypothetical protein
MIKHGQGRTNAERAKEWRDKQKKEDPEFLAKEAKRKAQSKTELGTEEQVKLGALDLIFKSQSKQSKLSHGARAKEQKKLNRAQFRLVKALFTDNAAQPANRDAELQLMREQLAQKDEQLEERQHHIWNQCEEITGGEYRYACLQQKLNKRGRETLDSDDDVEPEEERLDSRTGDNLSRAGLGREPEEKLYRGYDVEPEDKPYRGYGGEPDKKRYRQYGRY